MFDGTLGTWKTIQVNLELMGDVKHVCLRPYPVPKAHEAMIKNEVKRLVILGVLKEEN